MSELTIWILFNNKKPDDGQEVDIWLPGSGRIPGCFYQDGKLIHGNATIFIGSELYWMPVPMGPKDERA